MCLSCVSLKLAVTQTSSSGTTVRSCCPGSTFNPTTTVLFTSPLTGATIFVYWRFSWACSSCAAPLLHIGDSRAHASPSRGHLLRAGFGVFVIRVRLHDAALGLLHELLRGGLVGAGCRHRRCAGFGCGQRLIVNLLGHFPFVDQQFVAVKIVLRPSHRWPRPPPLAHGRR